MEKKGEMEEIAACLSGRASISVLVLLIIFVYVRFCVWLYVLTCESVMVCVYIWVYSVLSKS